MTVYRIGKATLAILLFGSRDVNIENVKEERHQFIFEISGADVPLDCDEVMVK